jgi:hypothetical protein
MKLRSATAWIGVLLLVVIGAGVAIAVSAGGAISGRVPLAVGQPLMLLEPEWLATGELPPTLPPTIPSPYVSRPNREYTAVGDDGTAFSVAAEMATGDQVAFKLPIANQSERSLVCQLELALPESVQAEVYSPDISFIESVMRLGPATWKFVLPRRETNQEMDYIIVVIAADDTVPLISTIQGELTPLTQSSTITESMSLSVSGGLPAETTMALGNMAPASEGTAAYTLGNISHVPGELSIVFSAITNIGGEGDTEYEDGEGDLGEAVMVALFIDNDQSGTWNAGDTGLRHDGTTYPYPAGLEYATFNSYDSSNWADVTVIPPLGAVDFLISWVVPASAGNDIQGDSLCLDIVFTLEEVAAP